METAFVDSSSTFHDFAILDLSRCSSRDMTITRFALHSFFLFSTAIFLFFFKFEKKNSESLELFFFQTDLAFDSDSLFRFSVISVI